MKNLEFIEEFALNYVEGLAKIYRKCSWDSIVTSERLTGFIRRNPDGVKKSFTTEFEKKFGYAPEESQVEYAEAVVLLAAINY